MTLPLILASSSTYRQKLLSQLGIPFSCLAPDIDETPLNGEAPEALVRRLATQKAQAVAAQTPHPAVIVGSDQVSVRDGQIIGKPHTHDAAVAQLEASSGRVVKFMTGLCVLNTATQTCRVHVEPFSVHFRQLCTDEIERYLHADKPYDCAGSFKLEQRGIMLFSKLEGRDFNALIGLPLIALVDLLRAEGLPLP